MAKLYVDTSSEIWGSKTSIAHLAQFSFDAEDSRYLTVEQAMSIAEKDWHFELDRDQTEMECGVGVILAFKDGSVLHVGAWAD
jgi:hypothetical protein